MLFQIGNIGREGEAVRTERLQLRTQLFQTFLIQVAEQDIETGLGKSQSAAFADTAGCTGHHGDRARGSFVHESLLR